MILTKFVRYHNLDWILLKSFRKCSGYVKNELRVIVTGITLLRLLISLEISWADTITYPKGVNRAGPKWELKFTKRDEEIWAGFQIGVYQILLLYNHQDLWRLTFWSKLEWDSVLELLNFKKPTQTPVKSFNYRGKLE